MGDRARELGRLDRVTDATFGVAYVLARAQDYAAALELGIPGSTPTAHEMTMQPSPMTLEGCGRAPALADPAAASSYFLEAIDIAERIDAPFRLTRIGAALGASLVFMGEATRERSSSPWPRPPAPGSSLPRPDRGEAFVTATLALA